jgi:hypothetical protein
MTNIDPTQTNKQYDVPVEHSEESQPQMASQMGLSNTAQPQAASTDVSAQSGSVNVAGQPSETSNQPSNQPMQPMPYKKPFNFVKVGFLFMLIILLAVGGYAGYKYFMTKKSAVSDKNATPTSVSSNENTNPQETGSMSEPTSASESSEVESNPNRETIDFSKCNPGDGYSRSVPAGSTYLSVIDVDDINSICRVEILNEIDTGFVKYSCSIPKSLGEMTFDIGSSGSDFSQINSYCTEVKNNGSLSE